MRNAIRYKVTLPLAADGLRLEPGGALASEGIRELLVHVFYTTDSGTRGALDKAWALAENLRGHLRLVFIYSVHYALPLTEPAVSLTFLQAKLAKLAGGFPGNASVDIYLCREPFRVLSSVLPEASIVVVGGKRRPWPTKEQRLESRLKKLGHEVIFAETR